ncbi:MAG: DNA gyrase C-terminal beta-propeller domain-containing protein, partial [Vulcanimicrobiota bacterium]
NSQKEELEMLLDSKSRLWGVVKEEMQEMARLHGDSRRTRVLVKGAEEYSYDEQSLIVDEDATVLVSRDGWVRRVGSITDLSKARLRAGDELQYAVRGSTLSPIVFFTNYGICYSCLVNDIVQTTGYGEPIHGSFAFKDGEKIVACFILDQRVLQGSVTAQGEEEPEWQGVALTSDGKGFRFSLQGYMESSTKNGRKFARPSGGAQVIGVKLGNPSAQLLATATRFGRGSLCKLEEVNFLSGAGKGVTVIKLERDDRVVAFQPLDEQAPEGLRLIRDEGGREIIVHPKDVKLTARAGKGQRLLKRGLLNPVVEPVRIVGPEEPSLDSNPEPVSSGSLPMKSEYDPNFDNEQLDLGLNSQDPDTNDTRDTE